MPDLHFRHFGTLPNAFALPGNIIVVTDALVTMAEDEEEIAAVLAHELGHLRAHHPVQRLLLGSTALLVLTAATGDLSTLTSFAATLPFLLLQNGYSREFESAADTFAAERLLEAGIDPARLAAILMRMDKTHDDFVSRRFTYLSTHPATEDRVQKLRGPADE
ncbi:MAG TPA: M48 family metallopeptidase, partial [Candidatus Synoicihabitans sp.]|nr:M48 family metallopeptidase [Candidatus Synoicihabitans sp.]